MISAWNSKHAAELRAFLNSETGRLFTSDLASVANDVKDGSNFESEALNSREGKGARKVLTRIDQLSTFVEQQQTERDYVDIEVDKPTT